MLTSCKAAELVTECCMFEGPFFRPCSLMDLGIVDYHVQ